MKAAPFDYHRPTSLAEALALLRDLEDARPLAGGQSLGPMMNLRVAQPAHLIDLAGVPDLAGVEESDDCVKVGAMTTQRALERSPVIARHCPLVREALNYVGHQQTRNRGTLGGSLCHLDPAAELPLAAAALDAQLTIAGPAGARVIPFAQFSTGYLSTSLDEDEILTSVVFPKTPPTAVCAFEEFARRHGDFAIAAVGVSLDFSPDGRIADARIALGGIGAAPVRARDAEAALTGRAFDAASQADALGCLAGLDCDGDAVNPAAYRRHLVRVLTERAFAACARKKETRA
jgi:carbon-monoxide dehydrogenase medium subunit